MKKTTYPLVYPDTIWTYSDLQDLPADGKIHQILNGVLYMVPSPSSNHQKLSKRLFLLLNSFVSEKGIGEVYYAPLDVVFSQTQVVQPDLMFISEDRKEIVREEGVYGAPDLVAEILSPTTRKIDENIKKDLYESQGVREYLLVYPAEKKVVQYVLTKGKFQKEGVFVSGDRMAMKTMELELTVTDIFK